MAEQRDQRPAAAGHGHLRASHADREQVIGALKAAFVQGMLAKDEFDLRVGQAFASRTYAELAALTGDLPAGLAAAPPPQPVRAPGERGVLRPGRLIAAATVLYAGIWLVALFVLPMNSEGERPPGFALVVLTGFVYVGALLVAAERILEGWREKRAGRQLPPGRAHGTGGQPSRRPPSAGPGGQLPPVDPGHRHAAEAVRRHPPRPPLPVRGHYADGALAAGMAPG
jgi:Domain of unknown function (DUF1707)